MKRLTLLAGAALCLMSVAPRAQADPIDLGLWHSFYFRGPGSFGDGIAHLPRAPWTFTLGGPGHLTVTDVDSSGEQFRVYNFGVSLGLTSAPIPGFSCVTHDPDWCVADPNLSKGVFPLVPGDYSITIEAVLSPDGAGWGYFRVDELEGVIPEPGSWALVAGVLALLAGSRLRRFRRAAPPAA